MKRLVIDVDQVVGYYVFGKWNGIGRTTYELVMELAKRKDSLPFEIMLYSQNMRGIGAKTMNTGLKFRHIYLPHRKRFNDIARICRIRELFTGYDLMHIPHNIENVAHPDKCIVTLHDALFMHIQEERFGHKWMKDNVPPFMQKCRHIVTCSEYSKKDIMETMQIAPDKIDVVYWGIDHKLFHVLKKETVEKRLESIGLTFPYFLSVSCNAERKRTDELIHAYMDFYGDGTRNHLVLVWSNPPRTLLDEIDSHPAKDHIHFLNRVSDEDLAILYNGATAAFTPSMYEGFGLPLIEAMACGCPVLTANNSSLTEIGADAVHFLHEPIRQSVAEAMESIESGSLNLDILREKGLKRAMDFHWGKTADKMIDIYTKLLS